jgi:hypothetical protein
MIDRAKNQNIRVWCVKDFTTPEDRDMPKTKGSKTSF